MKKNAAVIIAVGIMGVTVNALGMCIFGAHGHSHGGWDASWLFLQTDTDRQSPLCYLFDHIGCLATMTRGRTVRCCCIRTFVSVGK